MAAIVQQPSAQEVSVARAFWNAKIEQHPNIAGLLAIAGEVAGYFVNGHFIVALARWIIRVSGYVAESALLFAVLWISGTSVAPGLIELFMSAQTMQYVIWIALITLALIPEVILGNAIVSAAGHWLTVIRDRHNIMAWVWAIAFTIPTLLFLILTALTLNAVASDGGNFVQASAGLVGWRCFAGWTYGLLELVFAGIGRQTLSQGQLVVTPGQPAPAAAPPVQQIDYQEIARQLLPTLREELKQANGGILQELREEIGRVSEQVGNLQETQNALLSEQESEPFGNLEENTEETEIVNLEDYRSEQESEPCGNTDSLPVVNDGVNETGNKKAGVRKLETPTKKVGVSGRKNARTAAARILQKFPDIGPSELAKRAQISKGYASKIIAERA